MSKTLYMSKEDTQKLTDIVIEFNNKNNPIKIFDECYDFYVETYNVSPTINDKWKDIIEIRREYEYKRITRSINRSKANDKVEKRDFENIEIQRRGEIDTYLEKVITFDPVQGKIPMLEYPEMIWSSIIKISEKYVQNFRFFGYTYKEDLISSAIEKGLKAVCNFSPVSSTNAFSYFTTIIKNSFLENIKKEYYYSNIKQMLNTKFYGSTNEEQSKMQENYIEYS